MKNWKAYLAEFVGTFVLVAFGCGVAVASGVDLVATSLAFGLAIVAMAYSIGNISGCHVNPAVSLAMYLTKKLSLKDFGFYVLAQVLGALLGSLVLMVFFGSDAALGANSVANLSGATFTLDLLLGLFIEIVLTFVFIYAILGVTSKTDNQLVVGLVIGLTLTLVHLLGVNLTGTSVNPARSLAPALLQDGGATLNQIWVFIVGPLAGSVLAVLTHKCLSPKKQG